MPATPDGQTPTGLEPAQGSPFEIGDWWVEPELLRLSRGDASCKLEPMAMRLLVFLAERPSEVVSRAEILQEVWEGRAVVDETLSRAMSLVRRALGDSAQEPSYIDTIPTRGYRLIAPVTRPGTGTGTGDSSPAAKSTPTSETAGQWRWRAPALLIVLLSLLILWWVARSDERVAREAATAAASAGETTRRPGIVVLPFKLLSADSDNAYLASGLTEELTHQLASVSGLRVVSRTSAMHFRDSDALAPEIAEALGVDYLLEGTLLVVGQRLRITAQLIRPDQDEHLLSRSYDRDLSEVLDLQREVAKDVVEHTRTRLSRTEELRLARDQPVNSSAYRVYLQGHQLIQQRRDLDRGLDLLEQAVALDPRFAPAWAALADAFLLGNSYWGLSENAAYSGAEDAIGKALELDPGLAAAHVSLGLLRLQRDRNWSGSEASYLRAIELERSHVTARQWYSELLSLVGRHREALQQVSTALELDPLSPLIHAAAGQRLSAAGRYQEALGKFEDAEALGGGFAWLFRERAWALARLGRVQEALEIQVGVIKRRDDVPPRRIEQLDRALKETGSIGYYASQLEALLERPTTLGGHPTWVAEAYSGTGQTERALEWLAKAVQERNLWLPHTLKSPAFDRLRDDPRFARVLGDVPPWRPGVEPSEGASE